MTFGEGESHFLKKELHHWVFFRLVAMNYQTAGKFMDVYFGRFLSNGGCGYVLKPTYLRYDNAAAAAAAASSSIVSGRLSTNLYSSNTPQILHIKVQKKNMNFISNLLLWKN